jgi:hypothetical protein
MAMMMTLRLDGATSVVFLPAFVIAMALELLLSILNAFHSRENHHHFT